MAGTTDTVPAMLTPGEFVIKQESAAMLGEPLLQKLNAISDNAAHGNIDALIRQAQLANMKPMYGGGKVVPGYQEGGGVGEAGRKYPPGTLMSPFMGDKAPIPEAWMQPATDSIPSPEEVAEFDRMIEMLQAQELLKKKMKEMQALGMFSDKKAVEYKEGEMLPPWRGKRNPKGNLYEEGMHFPVYREGNQ